MAEAQDLDLTQELEDGTSEASGQSDSTTQEETRQSERAVVNWQDDPEYRRQQAENHRRIAQAERAAQQAAQEAQQVRAQRWQEYLATLPEVERERALRQNAEQGMAQLQRNLELERMAQMREADIIQVTNKLGITRQDLEAALPESFDTFVLWDKAYEVQQAMLKKKNPPRPTAEESATENVDLGSGRVLGKQESYQKMLDAARKARDADKIFDVRRAAKKAGFTLK